MLLFVFFCYFLPLRSSVLPLYCCGYLHLRMKLISFHHVLPLPAVLLSYSLLQHGRNFFCSRCALENRACPPFWHKPAYPASQLAPLPEPQWDHGASCHSSFTSQNTHLKSIFCSCGIEKTASCCCSAMHKSSGTCRRLRAWLVFYQCVPPRICKNSQTCETASFPSGSGAKKTAELQIIKTRKSNVQLWCRLSLLLLAALGYPVKCLLKRRVLLCSFPARRSEGSSPSGSQIHAEHDEDSSPGTRNANADLGVLLPQKNEALRNCFHLLRVFPCRAGRVIP